MNTRAMRARAVVSGLVLVQITLACAAEPPDREVSALQGNVSPPIPALARTNDVTIAGTTLDCPRGNVVRARHVEIRALDAAVHDSLLAVLRELDTAPSISDQFERMAQFEPVYDLFVDLLMRSSPLGRDTTGSDGTFSLVIPSMDSVLVVAYAEPEDEPVYYAYRLISGLANRSLIFDMSGGQCGVASADPAGSIQQVASGLIFRDDFNRTNGSPGGNWRIQGNSSFWSISSNVLKGKPTDATLQQILVAPAAFGQPRGEMVVQARMRRVGTARTTFPGIQARHDSAGATWFRWVITNSATASKDEFRRRDVTENILVTGPSYGANNTWQQFKLAVKDSNQRGWKDEVLVLSLADTVLNGLTGVAGLSTGWFTSTSDHHEYDDFAVYKSNAISVSGLPSGFRARVGTHVMLASAGNAVVDLGGHTCPRPKVEVLNPQGAVVAEYIPPAGVWGGDEYSYSP